MITSREAVPVITSSPPVPWHDLEALQSMVVIAHATPLASSTAEAIEANSKIVILIASSRLSSAGRRKTGASLRPWYATIRAYRVLGVGARAGGTFLDAFSARTKPQNSGDTRGREVLFCYSPRSFE